MWWYFLKHVCIERVLELGYPNFSQLTPLSKAGGLDETFKQRSQRKAQSRASRVNSQRGQVLSLGFPAIIRGRAGDRSCLTSQLNVIIFVLLFIETFPGDRPTISPSQCDGKGYFTPVLQTRTLSNLLQGIQMAELEFEPRPSCPQSHTALSPSLSKPVPTSKRRAAFQLSSGWHQGRAVSLRQGPGVWSYSC